MIVRLFREVEIEVEVSVVSPSRLAAGEPGGMRVSSATCRDFGCDVQLTGIELSHVREDLLDEIEKEVR